MSDDPIFQLFTTRVARLASAPQRGVSIDVTAWEGQVAHLQASKIELVRDANGSDGGRVDVVDCGPFRRESWTWTVRRSSGGGGGGITSQSR